MVPKGTIAIPRNFRTEGRKNGWIQIHKILDTMAGDRKRVLLLVVGNKDKFPDISRISVRKTIHN